MTKFTDGTKTIEITMQTWDGTGYGPDWSNDCFEIGTLDFDEESGAYKVDDVNYLIDYANDWKNCTGDFCEEEDPDENRSVVVNEL